MLLWQQLLGLLSWCPIFKVNSMQLILRLWTYRFHLWLRNLQMSCRIFTTWQGTSMVVPVMAAKVTCPISHPCSKYLILALTAPRFMMSQEQTKHLIWVWTRRQNNAGFCSRGHSTRSHGDGTDARSARHWDGCPASGRVRGRCEGRVASWCSWRPGWFPSTSRGSLEWCHCHPSISACPVTLRWKERIKDLYIEWWMYMSGELFLRTREGYFGAYFLSCEATQEINTKISLD